MKAVSIHIFIYTKTTTPIPMANTMYSHASATKTCSSLPDICTATVQHVSLSGWTGQVPYSFTSQDSSVSIVNVYYECTLYFVNTLYTVLYI